MGRVTLKVDIKERANKVKEHVVRIRITKDRESRYWPLSFSVPKSSFNEKGTVKLRNWIRSSHPDHKLYNERILSQYRKADEVVEDFEKPDKPPFTADDIISLLKAGGKPDLLLDYFAAHLVMRKKLAGDSLQKLRTLHQYKDTLTQLTLFLTETRRSKLPVRGLSQNIVLEFQTWLKSKYAPNTVVNKLTCLRKVVRESMDDGLIAYERYPFKNISLALKRKAVNRLREDDINKLADGPRRETKKARRVVTPRENARPAAMLMYLMQGIRLGDFVQLRRGNYIIENGQHRVKYGADKTQKERNILLPAEAVELIAPYLVREDGTDKEPKELLFPYLISTFDKLSTEEKLLYMGRATSRLYHQILRLGTDLGLEKRVTPHIMRHSFADLLRRNKVDLITIQMTLGHSDPRTTRDYMDSLDQEAVDNVVKHFERKRNGETMVKQSGPEGPKDDRSGGEQDDDRD